MAISGTLKLNIPYGTAEQKKLAEWLNKAHVGPPETPSSYVPIDLLADGSGFEWDKNKGSSFTTIENLVKWLELLIQKWVSPLRKLNGVLEYENMPTDAADSSGKIEVKANLTYLNDAAYPSHGLKKDGTPKAKPGPKPKTLKEILAEKKGEEVDPFGGGLEESPYNATEAEDLSKIVGDMQAKIVELQEQLAKKNGAKKQKVPPGFRYYRLTVPASINKEKFVEGLKLCIMDVTEIEVFE